MSFYEFEGEHYTGCGSLETFHSARTGPDSGHWVSGETVEPGWYWWPCFPGCLPDGDAVGPFQTERDAVIDAGGIWDDLSETNGAVS